MFYARRISMLFVAVFSASVPAVVMADEHPITFKLTEIGRVDDPLGLFSPDEIAEGGSTVQPSINYAEFPVDGGRVDLSVLVGEWCSLSECPFRFRLITDSGLALLSHSAPDYGMICQDSAVMTYDPIKLTMNACGNTIDFKSAR